MLNTEPISVVIVENQPLMLAALSTALSAEGMQVLAEVADSRMALQTVGAAHPRVILFSVGVPSLNDLQTISALRRDVPNVLILALVTGELPVQEQMALGYGAHNVLTKSAPRAELIAAVRKLAQKEVFSAAKKP